VSCEKHDVVMVGDPWCNNLCCRVGTENNICGIG
jgi:hypothetical protein